MRVLVIGSAGNMGRRYCAIVRYLGHEVVEHDLAVDPAYHGTDCCETDIKLIPPPLPPRSEYDKAIIATPTDTHVSYCIRLASHGKPFLCEKPISKDIGQVRRIAVWCSREGNQGFMVNNWAFTRWPRYLKPASLGQVTIGTHYTGQDGVWDFIQPLHLLSSGGTLTTPCDYPGVLVEMDWVFVKADEFQESYILMMQAFLADKEKHLWPIDADIVAAHERVLEYERNNTQRATE